MTEVEKKLYKAIMESKDEKFTCDICGRELPANAYDFEGKIVSNYVPRVGSIQAKMIEEITMREYDENTDCEVTITLDNMCDECFVKIQNAIKDTIEEIKK